MSKLIKQKIFVPGNVPSSKNSKRIVRRKSKDPSKKGRPLLIFSTAVKKYLTFLGINFFSSSRKEIFNINSKINLFQKAFSEWVKPESFTIIGFHFVRTSHQRFDFQNIVQIILDLMTAGDYIEDDSIKYIVPVPISIEGKKYSISKTKPGVYIYELDKTLIFSLLEEDVNGI